MKKIFLAMLLAGCSCAVFAQEVTLTTTKSYNAYGTFTATPPESVRNYVVRDYPSATTIYWRQSSPDWWHGYYLNNDQPTHVYYTTSFHVPTAGQSFTVALPVRQTWVPDEVVAKSVQIFGPTLYDIHAMKGSDKQDMYLVRVLENGELSNHYIDATGNSVVNVYRIETADDHAAMTTMDQPVSATDETLMDANADGTKVKIKTKTSDGKETKTKIKDGKVKTKED